MVAPIIASCLHSWFALEAVEGEYVSHTYRYLRSWKVATNVNDLPSSCTGFLLSRVVRLAAECDSAKLASRDGRTLTCVRTRLKTSIAKRVSLRQPIGELVAAVVSWQTYTNSIIRSKCAMQ